MVQLEQVTAVHICPVTLWLSESSSKSLQGVLSAAEDKGFDTQYKQRECISHYLSHLTKFSVSCFEYWERCNIKSVVPELT